MIGEGENMSYYDLPLDELKTYLPAREEPNDFNSFWENTLLESREHPLRTYPKIKLRTI